MTNCPTFDQWAYAIYHKAMKNTTTQPTHTTFFDRQYHGLHSSFLLINQWKSRARKIDVLINSVDTAQYTHFGTRLVVLHRNHRHTHNFQKNSITSLSRYVFYLRDADNHVTTIY